MKTISNGDGRAINSACVQQKKSVDKETNLSAGLCNCIVFIDNNVKGSKIQRLHEEHPRVQMLISTLTIHFHSSRGSVQRLCLFLVVIFTTNFNCTLASGGRFQIWKLFFFCISLK